MPIRGDVAHIDLTVSDLDRATAFYDRLLRHLGFERVSGTEEPLWHRHYGNGAQWGIALHQAAPDRPHARHDRYAPGLHHLAFHAESRADVDAVHALALKSGLTVLDPPSAYSGPGYAQGYYAVFIADPDGIKLEVCHIPPENP